MKAFHVIAHNHRIRLFFSALAASSFDAAMNAIDLFDGEPCSVSVTRLAAQQ